MIKKSKKKKIATHIPAELLKRACELTELNQTETLIAGLKELIAQEQRRQLVELKGKIHVEFNADKLRERVRL